MALIISPSNSRYADLDKNPNSLFVVPFLSLRYALGYILDLFLSLPLPHLVLLATFISLGLLSNSDSSADGAIKKSILNILLTLAVTVLLVTAIQAPTTYLYAAPPDPRGQSLSRFVILAGFSIAAWMFGTAISPYFGRYPKFLAISILLLSCIYTARATINIYGELPGFIERAQLWDVRDAQIRSEIDQGATRIEINAIDTKEIATRDIIRSQDFGKWVTNACGVKYFDVEAMKATP